MGDKAMNSKKFLALLLTLVMTFSFLVSCDLVDSIYDKIVGDKEKELLTV